MRKLFSAFLILNLVLLNSCDDGDIITVELDFDDTFEACEGANDLVFYKTKDDPSESLSLLLNNVSLEDIFEVDDTGVFEKTYTISSTNPFNYRTYSDTSLPSDLFCNTIPNSEVNITQDIESTSGSALLRTELIEDDGDGIPAELENQDPNGDGNFDDAQDTDGDGLPDYIDADDDGDNILTKNEDPDPNEDGDLSDAQDTDADGVPDYLDDDDDGDGINTRDEENDSQDQNPANDFTVSELADYLNPDIANTVNATAYREHTITQSYVVTLTLSNFDLVVLSQDSFDFGVLEDGTTTDTRTETPDFP
ncbi:hypothetical protein [uncultured Algibacter sp.]|uniref:hypothetical protein n=1 Tax=uncultured Algibacter sp. TaxID=298659 RepID=UPI002627CF08|nr:hypothetical protein [uncultured Algibacter sp.]